MENLLRTAAHFARVEQRRAALRDFFAHALARRIEFVWEIGSGHGHFLTAYAGAHPDDLCIGIDLSPERIERAERKLRRAGLGNLHFVRADAGDFLAALPEAARFNAVYLLFPDPWPKRRHHKNRLMRPAFLADVARRAKPGARLYFRTDHELYFTEAQEVIAASHDWRLSEEPWPWETPTVFQQRAPGYRSLVAIRKESNLKTG